MRRFEQRLAVGPPIVADGGMGSLVTAAVPRLRSPEEANLRAPDAVVSLHVSFINAGAELIETNTFGANRRKLAQHFLEEEFERINSTAVKLARNAREMTGRDVFIAGSIGPIGEAATSRVRRQVFADQAQILEGRGADLFMVETFYDLDELCDAVEAVRGVSSLPIVALMTFDDGAETLAGVRAAEAGKRLAEMDVAAIGANHGAGLMAALAALDEMSGDGKALAALPNIGLAIVGGCCGTTPTEISAIRSAVEEERKPRARLDFEERELVVSLGEEQAETGLARALREGDWVVSIQLDPPLGGNIGGLVELSQALKDSGKVGFVDVNDNAGARAGMNAIMFSAAIERATGLETIPHLTTRDYTIMGLEAILFGAHAEGVRNVLAVTGDPPEVGDYPGSSGIFEIDAIGLTRLMSQLNRGEDFNGRPIDAPTSFYIGVAVNPTADDLELEVERYRRKVDAGAHFAMTQLVFDLEHFDRFFDRFGGPSPIPVLVGICPIWSYRFALRLHNELPGILVPEDLQERLRDAGSNAAEVGMAAAKELYAAAKERAAGVYLVAPYRQPLNILNLIS